LAITNIININIVVQTYGLVTTYTVLQCTLRVCVERRPIGATLHAHTSAASNLTRTYLHGTFCSRGPWSLVTFFLVRTLLSKCCSLANGRIRHRQLESLTNSPIPDTDAAEALICRVVTVRTRDEVSILTKSRTFEIYFEFEIHMRIVCYLQKTTTCVVPHACPCKKFISYKSVFYVLEKLTGRIYRTCPLFPS